MPSAIVMNNTCFDISEWCKKATYDHIGGIPSALSFENPLHDQLLMLYLQCLLKNPADVYLMITKFDLNFFHI